MNTTNDNNNIIDKKINTDEKQGMRSNVDLRPKLETKKKTGVLDGESIKLGSVDEDEDDVKSSVKEV